MFSKTKHFFLFIFFFLFFFMLGFYAYYLYKHPKSPNKSDLLKYYPKDLILKTGGYLSSPNERFQHFLNFHPLKQKGAIRIGAFGDSFTEGSEVKKKETYPYQLQELFNNNFPDKKIEVLNFGKSGVGFQHQFFLWKEYAEKYDLDYILLGPQGFYSGKDTTFLKDFDFKKLGYPKTRFILSKNSQLKLVHIKGDTLKERYKNYHKLISSWTALRYDRRPFPIWEKFFPFLRSKIQNPFYYINKPLDEEAGKINYYINKPLDEEAGKINKILLKKMKHQHNKKILFFVLNKTTFNNYQSIANLYNLNFIPSSQALFYGVFFHKSALGNERIANIYFNALMGEKRFFLNTIKCYFKEITNHPPSPFIFKDLYFAKSIQIIGGKSPISHLKHNSSDHHYNKGTYFNHKVKGTKSFIAFSNTVDFLQTPYVPLPIQLKEGMKIYIQRTGKNRLELGSIKSLDSYGKFFNFYAKYTKSAIDIYTHWFSYFVLDEMPYFLKEKLKDQKQSAELFVEDYQLGALHPDKRYGHKTLKFIPDKGYKKTFLMMGISSGHVREKDFPDEFPLYIQYNMINGESFKSLIPNWKCKKEKEPFYLNLPNFEPLTLE